MRIRIDYTTRYDYALPASHVVQLLRVQPRATEDQHILSWRLEVDADGSLRSGFDVYGNITHIFYAERALDALTLRVTGEVSTSESHGVVRGSIEPLAPLLFRRTTPLSTPDAALRSFAAEHRRDDTLSTLHALLVGIHGTMTFDAEATGTGTDAVTAFGLKRGVCQDFSHIFLACARHLEIPARYVSGHFVQADSSVIEPAGHAWVEAWDDTLGWVGFDPTNGISVTEAYVRVAVGHDYIAAAPVRGARRGGGDETMAVSVSAIDVASAQSQS
ncbi:MAG TPA: transglutaminase family protein, partial [Polymorphobacter sp.]|nr:transglutaminase family protein [Polymorphobacter sp.]